uniref:Uncharacterized protein n=2 Tax=viral metagenome TaxID=1070528 RepID=A0A6M3JUM3_9ZZZZ
MLQELKEQFNSLVAKRNYIAEELDKDKAALLDKEVLYKDYFEAREVVNTVIKLTQDNFKGKVEPLVTMAIRSVFEKPYDFELRFEKKRNQLECRPVLIKDGNEETPKADLGGSVVDIISLALRVILWAVEKPRSRNMILLDEPMKNIGQGEELILAGQIMRDISSDLGLQLIVVTHSQEFGEIADTVYKVTNDDVESTVELVKGEFVPIPKLADEDLFPNLPRVKKRKRISI